MASWKKVIVSGSSAELSSLSLDTALTVPNGGTGLSTVATNGILFGNGTSALQVASAAANSVLTTNGSNVPSLSATLPTAVQGNITQVGTIGTGVWEGTAIADAYVANNLTISGGTVNNTVIGGTTAAAGTFTTGVFTSGIEVTGSFVSIDATASFENLDVSERITFGNNGRIEENTGTDTVKVGTFARGITTNNTTQETTLGTFSSPQITITDSNNRVGINESSPGYDLDVAGTGSFDSIILQSNGGIVGAGSSIILTGASSALTGSFTGSFIGDGSGLSGVTANFPATAKTSPLAGTDLFFYNDNSGANPSKQLSLGTLVTDIAGDGLTVVSSKNLHVNSGSLVAYYSSSTFAAVSGDITITAGGTAAIGSGVIVDADINASANIATSKLANDTISGVTLGSNLSNLVDGNGIADFTYNGSAGATVTVEADGSTLSVGASGVKVADAGITETQLNTSVAGTGLSGGAGSALSVDYGSSAGTAAQGNTSVTFAGTSNEIELTTNTFSTVGGGGSVTIGLPDDVTIGNDLTVDNDLSVVNDAVINGDLIVRGTASFEDTINLEVADRFILLASGSTSDGDGGIVIQTAADKTGVTFAWDGASSDRWGIATGFHASASAYTPEAYMAAVIDIDGGQSDTAAYQKVGNIKIDSEEIYIYS